MVKSAPSYALQPSLRSDVGFGGTIEMLNCNRNIIVCYNKYIGM